MAPKKQPGVASHKGMRAVDLVRNRYMGKRRCLVVKEWVDEELYPEGLPMWFPPITIDTMQAVEVRGPKDNLERQLLMMVLNATDEGGSPLFQVGDVHVLRTETEYSILQRIFDFMLKSWVTKDQALKMVAEDPTLGPNSPSQSDSVKPSKNSAM